MTHSAIIDRGESTTLMEPMRLSLDSRHRGELTDLAIELAARSSAFRGSLPPGIRAELPELPGTDDRQARRIVSALVDQSVVTATSSRAPLHISFPARLASRWMPGLFPDRV